MPTCLNSLRTCQALGILTNIWLVSWIFYFLLYFYFRLQNICSFLRPLPLNSCRNMSASFGFINILMSFAQQWESVYKEENYLVLELMVDKERAFSITRQLTIFICNDYFFMSIFASVLNSHSRTLCAKIGDKNYLDHPSVRPSVRPSISVFTIWQLILDSHLFVASNIDSVFPSFCRCK
jgi:hypothetical protein